MKKCWCQQKSGVCPVIHVFLGSSLGKVGTTVPSFIIVEYVWQILGRGGPFCKKIVVKKLQKGNMYLKSDSSLRNHKHFIIISVFGKWQTISILKMMKNELMKCRNRADSGYKERDRLTKTWATAEMALKLSDGFLKRAFHIFLFLRPCFTFYNYNIIEATTWGVIWKKLFLEIS